MKRFAACLVLALLAAAATAQETPPATEAAAALAAPLKPLHQGYAFEETEVLVRQRLFGLAHGLSLLAGACLDLADQSGSTQEAYAAWHARQGAVIDGLVQDLSRYYFGTRAEEAHWGDLVRGWASVVISVMFFSAVQLIFDLFSRFTGAGLPTAIVRPHTPGLRRVRNMSRPSGQAGG